MIYRSNHLIHLNYAKADTSNSYSYANVTFKVSGNKLTKPKINDGIYLTKLK